MGGGARASATAVVSALRTAGAPASELQIRPAVRSDVDAVLALERASFSDPWSRASFTSILGDPRVYFVVAQAASGAISGYLAAWFVPPDGEIATLAVDPGARRQGVGALLLDSAIDAGRLRGVGELFLEVRESNEAAQQLYRSRGFSLIGRRRGYYRNPVEDARVLRRVLE
jgi:[ribosomal protein S18]-alanine N-acetyltransferase